MENVPAQKKNFLPVDKSVMARAWTWFSKAGPYLIAQSDTASQRWADHKGKVASIEALASLMLEEGKSAAHVKEELIKQLVGADAVKAAQIRATMREVDASIRTVHVLSRATQELNRLPPVAGDFTGEERELNAHWADRFFQLARDQNEEWRVGLLAKALAIETSEPGSLDLEVLWTIGTLSEKSFHALAHVLDVSVDTNDGPFIPYVSAQLFAETEVSDCLVKNCHQYGHILLVLTECGLLHNPGPGGPVKDFQINEIEKFRYSSRTVRAKTTKSTNLNGFILTSTGRSLAKLYAPKEIPLGLKIYEDFIARLPLYGFEITSTASG
jgi:hypothetical protein